MNCKRCHFLGELFESAEQTNRNYWIMTELFVWLHDGRDYCKQRVKKPQTALRTYQLAKEKYTQAEKEYETARLDWFNAREEYGIALQEE